MRPGFVSCGLGVFLLVCAFHPFASSPILHCRNCKAILYEGEVVWTCPHANLGADGCIIDASGCQEFGVCP